MVGRVLRGVPPLLRARRASLPQAVGDTILSLLALLFAVAPLLHGGPPNRPPGTGMVPLAVLCAACLLPRTRWPIGALVAVGGLATLYVGLGNRLVGVLPTVLIAVYSTVAY